MALVGRFIRDAHGEKCDDGRDEVQTGMQCFGEYAQAARTQDEESLQRNEYNGGADAQQRRRSSFRVLLVLPGCHDV